MHADIFGFVSHLFKSALEKLFREQNRDVREILSNPIGYLENWELEKIEN